MKRELESDTVEAIILEYWPSRYFLVDLMILEQTTEQLLAYFAITTFSCSLLTLGLLPEAPLLCWSHTFSLPIREASSWQHPLLPGTIPGGHYSLLGSLLPLPSPPAPSCLFCPHFNTLYISSLFWTVCPGEILGCALSPDGLLNVLFSSWRCILFSWNNLCQFSLEIWKMVSLAGLFCLCRDSAVIHKGFYSWRFSLLLCPLSLLLISLVVSLLLGVADNLWEHTQLHLLAFFIIRPYPDFMFSLSFDHHLTSFLVRLSIVKILLLKNIMYLLWVSEGVILWHGFFAEVADNPSISFIFK